MRRVLGATLITACALALLPGCSTTTEPVSTTYGRRGGAGRTSVNGTSVLAEMFEAAGHQVVSRGGGAANIESCQVIVWAPNNFRPPTPEARELIHQWLEDQPGRTFIYIGRDYDAQIEYWQHLADNTTGEQAEEALRRLAVARSSHATRRAQIPADEYSGWFVARRDHHRQRVEELSGPWSADVDPADAEIVLQAHFDAPTSAELATAEQAGHEPWMEPEFEYEVLLAASAGDAADDDPLDEEGGIRPTTAAPLVTRVTHYYWDDSELIVVTNGSFLLNLPLINHEHRKLAGMLIAECPDEPVKVAFWDGDVFRFVESGPLHNPWAVFTTWPLSFIWFHVGVLGILFLMWKFPVFGPQKDLPQVAPSDFAKHVNAVGDLMAATNDKAYAQRRLDAYAKNVQGESRRQSPAVAKVLADDATADESSLKESGA